MSWFALIGDSMVDEEMSVSVALKWGLLCKAGRFGRPLLVAVNASCSGHPKDRLCIVLRIPWLFSVPEVKFLTH